MRQRVRAIRRLLGIRTTYRRLDRTAKGFHMVIRWDTALQPVEIIALQAMLGSDPTREALNLMRVRSLARGTDESEYWNILYARKCYPSV
jgi:hypothetical protein